MWWTRWPISYRHSKSGRLFSKLPTANGQKSSLQESPRSDRLLSVVAESMRNQWESRWSKVDGRWWAVVEIWAWDSQRSRADTETHRHQLETLIINFRYQRELTGDDSMGFFRWSFKRYEIDQKSCKSCRQFEKLGRYANRTGRIEIGFMPVA